MNANQISNGMIRGYLLGKLPDGEQRLIDEELGEPEFYDRVTVVEDNLIDEYVQNLLSTEDRQMFEQRLMRTARQRERVHMARAFFDGLDEARPEQSITAATPQSTEQMIAGYLLGRLTKAEQQIIDEELGDPAFYDRVTSVEDGLIDDYVLGRLGDADRELFEKRLMRTQRQRDRVRLAQVFFDVVEESNLGNLPAAAAQHQTVNDKDNVHSWWQSLLDYVRIPNLIPTYAMAAAALVMLAGGALMIWKAVGAGGNQAEIARLKNKEQELLAQNQDQRNRYESALQNTQSKLNEAETTLKQRSTLNEDLQKQLKDLEKSNQTSRQLTRDLSATVMSLKPPKSRGGTDDPVAPLTLTQPLKVNQGNGLAVFNVQLDNPDFESYRAVVTTEDGAELVIQNQLKPKKTENSTVVVVSFPASQLAKGQYVLKVFGLKEGTQKLAGEFHFQASPGTAK